VSCCLTCCFEYVLLCSVCSRRGSHVELDFLLQVGSAGIFNLRFIVLSRSRSMSLGHDVADPLPQACC